MAYRNRLSEVASRRSARTRSRLFPAGLVLALGISGFAGVVARGVFTELAMIRGVGYQANALVGPGPTAGSERYYISYAYPNSSADLVVVDPSNGSFRVFPSPDPHIGTAWAMVVGPDGRIYLGTDGGKLLRLDPRTGAFVDLGRASPTESMIWQLVVGADQKLYGCTYPGAKLIRYDPAMGKSEDLGRMDSTQMYARSLAADRYGFVYTWVGLARNSLVGYEIRSGEHRQILPMRREDTLDHLRQGEDGHVYVQLSGKWFRLEGWNAVPMEAARVPRLPSANRLSQGRIITRAGGGSLDIMEPVSKKIISQPYGYAGKEMSLFRLGLGPDGMLYASTAMPLHLLRIDPAGGHWTNLGSPGTGEAYSFLAADGSLLIGAYAGRAPLMLYNPRQPYNASATGSANPVLVTYPGENRSWRPLAMIGSRTGEVYVGSIPGYGLRGGSLDVFASSSGRHKGSYPVYPDQSIVSLTGWNNLIVGGTSTRGGGGSVPATTEARVFVWDPATKQKQYDLVPVPGANNITDLATAPNGLVFGIAGALARENELFVLDPQRRQVMHHATLPYPVNAGVANSIGVGPDGRFYCLYPGGIYAIDPATYRVSIEATYGGGPVTAGFALSGRNVYFGSGPRLVRYTLPEGRTPQRPKESSTSLSWRLGLSTTRAHEPPESAND
jgi:streptogramin lyase